LGLAPPRGRPAAPAAPFCCASAALALAAKCYYCSTGPSTDTTMRRGDEASLPLRSQAKPRRPDCVRNCLTCRCTVHCSAWCVVACVACIAGVVAAGRELARHPFPVPATPPPPPCGVWPYDNPCEHCLYGVAQTLTVGPGTTCDSLARRLSVPQFELFNRNRSTSCCQQWNISLTDRIDVCRGPDREQWRRAGHPRQLPHANIIFSYIGAIGQHVQGPQNADLQLPESINVAAIGPIQDDILPGKSGNGFFRFEGEPGSNGFTGNCSVQVDPTSERRGSGGAVRKLAAFDRQKRSHTQQPKMPRARRCFSSGRGARGRQACLAAEPPACRRGAVEQPRELGGGAAQRG
jgi:hypothetical protein